MSEPEFLTHLHVEPARIFCGLVSDHPAHRRHRLIPISTPTIMVLGPTLAATELAGRKMLALVGRAEAHDFADVYVLAQRFGTDLLL